MHRFAGSGLFSSTGFCRTAFPPPLTCANEGALSSPMGKWHQKTAHTPKKYADSAPGSVSSRARAPTTAAIRAIIMRGLYKQYSDRIRRVNGTLVEPDGITVGEHFWGAPALATLEDNPRFKENLGISAPPTFPGQVQRPRVTDVIRTDRMGRRMGSAGLRKLSDALFGNNSTACEIGAPAKHGQSLGLGTSAGGVVHIPLSWSNPRHL